MIVRGVRLELHPPGDYVSDQIRATGDFYEAAILDEIAGRIRGGVLVDIGAHLGNHSAFLAAFVPHSTIHAFEPVPANLELLRRNVAAHAEVVVHDYALSDRAGELELDVPANLGHSAVSPGGALRVQARPLDELALDDVALVKLDVERHEPEVLAGAVETLFRCRPLVVIEDWDRRYAELLPGYAVVAEWARRHQTYLYAPT